MSGKRALQSIALISLAGMLFSGALTWREFSGAGASCTALGAPGTILGLPPCVYGLVMYATVFVISLLGLRSVERSGGTATAPDAESEPTPAAAQEGTDREW